MANGQEKAEISEETCLIPTPRRWITVGISTRPSILRFLMTGNSLQPDGAGLGRVLSFSYGKFLSVLQGALTDDWQQL
jgi:hypothetical protein